MLTPFKLLEEIAKLFDATDEYHLIYDKLEKVIEMIDKYDDSVRDALLFLLDSSIIHIDPNIRMYLKIILQTEKDFIRDVISLMKENEMDPQKTNFEKLYDVTSRMVDKHKEKKEDLTKSEKIDIIKRTGNTVNNIYKLARGIFRNRWQ